MKSIGQFTTRTIISMCVLMFLGCERSPNSTNTYPQRPIKLIVPFAPGGGSDTFARIIQSAIEDEQLLPQPLVIINVSGAGGTVGSRRVKNARPDGYTLLLLHEGIITSLAAGQATYGPTAFAPIAATGSTGAVICVAADSPYQSLADLVTAATEQPDSLLFSCSIGAPSQFAGLMLEQSAPGCQFRYVQSGGGAKRFAGIQGGHADATSLSLAEYAQFKTAGLRALALLDSHRHPSAPEVPTAVEQGYDVTATSTQFWWAPKGTQPEKLQRVAEAVERAMKTSQVQKRLSQLLIDPVVLRGEQLKVDLAERTQRIDRVANRPATPLPHFPTLVLIAVGVLSLCVAITRRTLGPSTTKSTVPLSNLNESCRVETPADVRYAWRRVLGVLTITCIYVALLQFQVADYRIATFAFVLATGLLLVEPQARQRVTVAGIAIALSLGLHLIFTRVFVIDLP
ncbi:MAG: tripartite tricarboxylate transporter substrate-binding protein [Pirellulaceae bacterium]